MACVTQKFTISGIVSGLQGTGLELEDNGANPNPITGTGGRNVPFTLPAIASGTTYAVTTSPVAPQPEPTLHRQLRIRHGGRGQCYGRPGDLRHSDIHGRGQSRSLHRAGGERWNDTGQRYGHAYAGRQRHDLRLSHGRSLGPTLRGHDRSPTRGAKLPAHQRNRYGGSGSRDLRASRLHLLGVDRGESDELQCRRLWDARNPSSDEPGPVGVVEP